MPPRENVRDSFFATTAAISKGKTDSSGRVEGYPIRGRLGVMYEPSKPVAREFVYPSQRKVLSEKRRGLREEIKESSDIVPESIYDFGQHLGDYGVWDLAYWEDFCFQVQITAGVLPYKDEAMFVPMPRDAGAYWCGFFAVSLGGDESLAEEMFNGFFGRVLTGELYNSMQQGISSNRFNEAKKPKRKLKETGEWSGREEIKESSDIVPESIYDFGQHLGDYGVWDLAYWEDFCFQVQITAGVLPYKDEAMFVPMPRDAGAYWCGFFAVSLGGDESLAEEMFNGFFGRVLTGELYNSMQQGISSNRFNEAKKPKRKLKETGEWSGDEEDRAWMDALQAAVLGISAEVPEFQFLSVHGFDKYQGPYARVSWRGATYNVWTLGDYDGDDRLWIEDFPVDNTSSGGNLPGFSGTWDEIADMLLSLSESKKRKRK